MDFGCNEFADFIEKLYDFFNDTGMCFLSGAIIFDNEDQWLYRSLMQGYRPDKTCKNVSVRTKAGTHRSFITQDDFRRDRRMAGAETSEYMIRNPSRVRQYDKTLKPPLTYLCDKGCRLNQDTLACMPGNKEPKGIAMFYPFTVINAANREISIEYLFMKLEQYATSVTRPVEASKHMGHFIARKLGHKKKMSHEARREDDPINYENESRDKEAIIAYYISNGATGNQVSQLEQKIDFFNRNVRVGNEVYVPSEILELILRIEIKAKDRFIKAIKKVTAAARLLPKMHGPGSDVWIRNRVALAKRANRSPFPGQTCMDATYLDSRNVETPYSREQLLTMARYMRLPVTDDMTKQQLCDIIVPVRFFSQNMVATPLDYERAFKNGEKVAVKNLVGRVLRGTKDADFTYLSPDLNRKLIMFMGSDGLEDLIGKSLREILITIGYPIEFIDDLLENGTKFKLLVAIKQNQILSGTWDNLLTFVKIQYKGTRIPQMLENNLENLKENSFKTGFQRIMAMRDPAFSGKMTAARLESGSGSLWEVRQFLNDVLNLNELYAGDGFTYTIDGKKGVSEYFSLNSSINVLGDAVLIDLN